MEFLLNRYRNITVLLVVLFAQLVLLAYQVKTNKDVPLIRVWAVSTVTPVEQGLEFVRRHTIGVVWDYFVLIHVKEKNDQLQHQLDQLKLENHFLRTQLSTAERAKELSVFQSETPSKTLAARVIGNGTGSNSKTVFVDRGSSSGVEAGMAVITPDGIVGKVVSAYPTASLIMLVTDPSFGAGVVSQKNHVHGTLRGQGSPKCRVDYIQNEEKVENGEWFFTAGDDRIFPRGFPVGQVASVHNGRSAKEIELTPSGIQGGLEEILIVTEGVHEPIPTTPVVTQTQKLLSPPTDVTATDPQAATATLTTDADKLRQEYQHVAQDENFKYGIASPKPPDFTKVGKDQQPAVKPAPAVPPAAGATATPNNGTPNQPSRPAPVNGQATTQNPASGQPAVRPPTATLGTSAQPPAIHTGVANAAEKPPASTAKPTATATQDKPRPRPPALVTDPTDADPDSEALIERVQRVQSKPPAVSETRSAEIASPPPSAPPKPKTPDATKTTTSAKPVNTTKPATATGTSPASGSKPRP
ncbi:MAG TPA: rod shape-determining protein MreC [Bryobacteraceae bacterium]|nr:rod shape-determining protein MreC [Bryobacteraceae bacterium]